MQDEAAKHLDASMIRSTRWYKAETFELDVASGTFDAAYFTHVLCSVEDPSMVLHKAARAETGRHALADGACRRGGRHLVTIGTRRRSRRSSRSWATAASGAMSDVSKPRGTSRTEGRAPSADAMPLPFRPHPRDGDEAAAVTKFGFPYAIDATSSARWRASTPHRPRSPPRCPLLSPSTRRIVPARDRRKWTGPGVGRVDSRGLAHCSNPRRHRRNRTNHVTPRTTNAHRFALARWQISSSS